MEKLPYKASYLFATVFKVGRMTFASGTWGSLAGLVPALILHNNILVYGVVFLCLFFLGVASSDVIERECGDKDPSYVVIDEFACIFPAFFMIPLTLPRILVGFCVYRLMDIIKPPPARYLERVKGGWGIMLDDLIAGIYANLALQIAILLKIM